MKKLLTAILMAISLWTVNSAQGRVGIGTNSPTDLLHLNAAMGDPLRVQVAGSTKLRVWNNGGTTIGSTNIPATGAGTVTGNGRATVFIQ